jgi:hypothetical protein
MAVASTGDVTGDVGPQIDIDGSSVSPAPGVVEQFADLAEDRRCNVVGPASEVCLSRSHRGGDP